MTPKASSATRPWWRRLHVRVEFAPRDVWLGLYIGDLRAGYREWFLCVLPTLPVVVRWDAR